MTAGKPTIIGDQESSIQISESADPEIWGMLRFSLMAARKMLPENCDVTIMNRIYNSILNPKNHRTTKRISMIESPFSPEEQEEFEYIANAEMDKWEAEHKSEIEAMSFPEWLVTAFQRFRRLQDSLSRNQSQKTNAEIANEIGDILKAYPNTLFAYDEKCLAKAHRAMQEFADALKKKERGEANDP